MNNLTEHPSWRIIDSSKMDTYQECPRKYFYEYILGWKSEIPAHDLYFGEAWHKAREYQLLNGYHDIAGAYDAFITYYRQYFPQESDEMFTPKDPTAVLAAITKFAEERSSDLEDNTVLHTEISGSVPISEDRVIYYRMDSVLERKLDGMIFSWDHKSAKKFSIPWANKFQLSLQNGTYTHCLYCMYPIEQVLGIEFCGTSFEFLKRGSKDRGAGYHIGFNRVPAYKTSIQMLNWIWQANDIYARIMEDMDSLAEVEEGDKVMYAFPMSTNSCMNYFGCRFHDYCCSWGNPLQYSYEPPLGMIQKFWDPTQVETREKINLDYKGL